MRLLTTHRDKVYAKRVQARHEVIQALGNGVLDDVGLFIGDDGGGAERKYRATYRKTYFVCNIYTLYTYQVYYQVYGKQPKTTIVARCQRTQRTCATW